jgi:hypothetical protein
MKNSDPRPWKCLNCGSVLGAVVRNTDHVSELVVFRASIPAGGFAAVSANFMRVFGVARFTTNGRVTCNCCFTVRDWYIGEDALKELLARRDKRTFGLDV